MIEQDTSDTIIVTGGMGAEVTRYDTLGWLENMPSMVRIRNNHGCGAYTDSQGNQVIWLGYILDYNTLYFRF